MKVLYLLLVGLFVISNNLFAQVGVNFDNSAPDPSAMLDVKSSTKGMLVPRMTLTERDAISSPANGLLVFCTDNNQYYSNKGTPSSPNWLMMSSQWLSTGSNIYFTGGNVGLGLSTPSYPVDVAGDINYSGTLRKNGIPLVTGVSGVTATLPLLSSGGVTPNITIQQANTTSSGFLTSSDWNTFNGKQNSLSFGNVSSGDMTITGGNGAVVGSGMNLAINKGNLTSTDLTITGGTAAVLGSGTAMTIKKGNLTESTSSVLTITSGANAVLGTGTSIQVKQANTGQSGYLVSADWNSFNNKVSSQWVTNGTAISYTSGKVGIGTSAPASSAALEVSSSTTGFLPPRMTTTQMNAITSPAEGLTVYNTTLKTLCWYDGTSWVFVPQDGKSCGTISYDGKTYETVVIGIQCWMKQNLNIGIRIEGNQEQTNNSTKEKYCYNNIEANCDVYGGLYQWDEMMNWTTSSNSNPSGRQGICPTGWHIPSDAEWCEMETYLDATVSCANSGWIGTDVGGKMKEAGTGHWFSPNIGATNSSGFTALPGGNREANGSGFLSISSHAYFWSATDDSSSNGWLHYPYYNTSQLIRQVTNKSGGFSVRCVKD